MCGHFNILYTQGKRNRTTQRLYILNHTNQMTLERRIHQKLNDVFSPLELKVVNFSGAHNAHAQSPNNGQSHFEIHMVSAAFKGKSRVACQKAVHQALEKEIKHIHALTMVLAPPDV